MIQTCGPWRFWGSLEPLRVPFRPPGPWEQISYLRKLLGSPTLFLCFVPRKEAPQISGSKYFRFQIFQAPMAL